MAVIRERPWALFLFDCPITASPVLPSSSTLVPSHASNPIHAQTWATLSSASETLGQAVPTRISDAVNDPIGAQTCGLSRVQVQSALPPPRAYPRPPLPVPAPRCLIPTL